jgi:hypothetical protein
VNQDAQYRVFFVCGPPKAGTTWVQHILDAHPKISCSGEGHFHTKVGKPFVAAMCEYNRFQGAVDDVVYQGHSSHVPISPAEMVEVVKDHILWLMIGRGVPPGVIWLGDKTPGYTEALPILHGLFPDARFVHVVRDPRDVLVSRVFQKARTGKNPNFTTSGHPLYYKTAEEVAVGWQMGTERVHRFKSDFPGLVHEVRYEDLLQHFRPTARALFDFFAAELSDEKLAEIERLTSFEAMTGGRPRGTADPQSFFRKGIAADWVDQLDEKAVTIIEAGCGGLMEAHGYHRRAPAAGAGPRLMLER